MFRSRQSLGKSFANAFYGIKYALGERNFFIQLIIGAIAIFGIFVFDTSAAEKIIIVILCASVLIIEIINTAIEKLLDRLYPETDTDVEIIKNLMASVVLVFSITALLAGMLIFGRHILR